MNNYDIYHVGPHKQHRTASTS